MNQQLKSFRVRVDASCPSSSSEFLRVGAGNIKRTWKREEVYVPFLTPFGVRESSQGCDGGIGKGREGGEEEEWGRGFALRSFACT